MKYHLIIIFIFVTLFSVPARGQSFPDSGIPFLVLPLDKPLFRPLFIPPAEKRRPALKEYMERPQFQYQMTPEVFREYDKKYMNRLQDHLSLDAWRIAREDGKWLRQEDKEAVAYYSAARSFDEWTDFHVGAPRIRLGSTFLDTLENIFIKGIPLITFPFTTPFRTVREAEQGFRFYLRKFPEGAYTVPALLSIARCRIHQKDFFEARTAYEYALRFIMERQGQFRPDLDEEYSWKILSYARIYPEELMINFCLTMTNSPGYFYSCFFFNPTNKSVNIYFTVSGPAE